MADHGAVATSTFEITSCNSFATPAPSSLICGKTGNLGTPHLLAEKTDNAANSYEACMNACYMVSNCVSFGYDPNTPSCQLYSAPIRNQKFTAVPAATKTFANRNCFSCTDSSVYTVHVPEPTQYVPSPMFHHSFGFDIGSVYIASGPNLIVDYDSVQDLDAKEGFSSFQITLNPYTLQDDTPGSATYTTTAPVIPDTSYTLSAYLRPSRATQASSDSLPNCQAKIEAFDEFYQSLAATDFQDLPAGWTRFATDFDVGDSKSVAIEVTTQCFTDDHAIVSIDAIDISQLRRRSISEKKIVA